MLLPEQGLHLHLLEVALQAVKPPEPTNRLTEFF
jgi:hypothetical protein